MSWKEKMKEWGGGDVSFLSGDGELISFAVVGEPALIEGKYKGKDTERIGCPAVTVDGFSVLVVGKRVARRLSKHEDQFKTWAFDLIRHGVQGDQKATYELTRCSDPELEVKLLEMALLGVSQEDIDAAVKAAEDIATG